MESKKFLTIEEVTAEFGLDAATLQKFVDSGEVKALADRGTWKYRRDELQALVDAGKIASSMTGTWMDEAAPTGGQVLTVGEKADDDLSYIELDEEALAEHATMITKNKPVEDRTPVEGIVVDEDWFVTSGAAETAGDERKSSSDVDVVTSPRSPLEVTDSDVRVVPGSKFSESALESEDSPSQPSDSDSDVRLVGSLSKLAIDAENAKQQAAHPDSDSDVKIAEEVPATGPDGSGIVLDFDAGPGATVSASGSSLRLPQTAGSTDADEDVSLAGAVGAARDSGISLPRAETSRDDSGLALEGLSDVGSAIRLGGDSTMRRSGAEESGISLEGDSHIELAGDSAVASGSSSHLAGLADDSGLSMESVTDDSGLAIESSPDDSGITLDDESGFAIEATGDSGIALEAGDSGLTLEGDSRVSAAPHDKTMADDDLAATMLFDEDAHSAGKTQDLNVTDELEDDTSFELNSGNAATAEIFVDDEDADEGAPTVVKKGRGARKPARDALSLSESFQLDEPPQVEDLEIAEDLDAGVEDEVEEEVELGEEEVFEASDETFSSGEVEAAEDEDYLTPAAAKKPVGPREPAWGMGMAVGLIACALVLTANSLILWAGVSTMWNGAEASGPAATLISSLGGLF